MALLFSHFSAGSDIGTKFSQFNYFGGNQGVFITLLATVTYLTVKTKCTDTHTHTLTHTDTHVESVVFTDGKCYYYYYAHRLWSLCSNYFGKAEPMNGWTNERRNKQRNSLSVLMGYSLPLFSFSFLFVFSRVNSTYDHCKIFADDWIRCADL